MYVSNMPVPLWPSSMPPIVSYASPLGSISIVPGPAAVLGVPSALNMPLFLMIVSIETCCHMSLSTSYTSVTMASGEYSLERVTPRYVFMTRLCPPTSTTLTRTLESACPSCVTSNSGSSCTVNSTPYWIELSPAAPGTMLSDTRASPL